MEYYEALIQGLDLYSTVLCWDWLILEVLSLVRITSVSSFSKLGSGSKLIGLFSGSEHFLRAVILKVDPEAS